MRVGPSLFGSTGPLTVIALPAMSDIENSNPEHHALNGLLGVVILSPIHLTVNDRGFGSPAHVTPAKGPSRSDGLMHIRDTSSAQDVEPEHRIRTATRSMGPVDEFYPSLSLELKGFQDLADVKDGVRVVQAQVVAYGSDTQGDSESACGPGILDPIGGGAFGF